jgi:hypothetical protein
MNEAKASLRLQLLVLLCQQLPHDDSERLMLLAVEDPRDFTDRVLAMSSGNQIWWPAGIVALLTDDLTLPLAV